MPEEEEIIIANGVYETEPVEEPVITTMEAIEQEPLVIETRGKWKDFEVASKQEFEVGKTYKIEVQGKCMFAISPTKPESLDDGMGTNSITFTKNEIKKLWIITG